MSVTRADSTRNGRLRFALCILGLGSLLIFLSLSADVQSAVGTADENGNGLGACGVATFP